MMILANLYDRQGELWRIEEFQERPPRELRILRDQGPRCFRLVEIAPNGRLIYREVGAYDEAHHH